MKLERVAHWVEIGANLGVVASLVILILQVKENTQTLQSQAIVQRQAPLVEPFVRESPLPEILARIKTVDGPEPLVQAFVDRYELTYAEGVSWTRHISQIWTNMAAEYALLGRSESLDYRIRALLAAQDQALWYENGGAARLPSPEFLEYVEQVRERG